jgi:hypothetical protein
MENIAMEVLMITDLSALRWSKLTLDGEEIVDRNRESAIDKYRPACLATYGEPFPSSRMRPSKIYDHYRVICQLLAYVTCRSSEAS